MSNNQAILTTQQALKVIRLKLEELKILETKLGVQDLTAESQQAAKDKRPTLFEAIQNIKYDLAQLKTKVELQDPEIVDKLIKAGLLKEGTPVPYLNLEAEVFTTDVTESIPNRYQFEAGIQYLEKDRAIPFKYYELQAINAPLFRKLKNPKLTNIQLQDAFHEHNRVELGLPKR